MTDRPTDKDTAEVVAWWRGWERATSHGYDWIDANDTALAHGVYRSLTNNPLDDTDAALELLGWLLGQMETKDQGTDYLLEHDAGWTVMRYTGYGHPEGTLHELPISGEPFRYAVCNLAVEVVKNKAQD